jgi:hypothetical protein
VVQHLPCTHRPWVQSSASQKKLCCECIKCMWIIVYFLFTTIKYTQVYCRKLEFIKTYARLAIKRCKHTDALLSYCRNLTVAHTVLFPSFLSHFLLLLQPVRSCEHLSSLLGGHGMWILSASPPVKCLSQ